jgi:hypothetical protein
MVDVLSNIYRTLPVLAARLGGFEPRRPRHFFLNHFQTL